MARITVEDCLEKVINQYDLVLLAKERTAQLNAGDKPLVEEDNDKKTVIALREIGDGKVSPDSLENTAVDKLRKNPESNVATNAAEDIQEDDFDKIYKGEVSKSGTAILPSKRVRQIPIKIESETDINKEEEKDSKIEATESIEEEEKEPIDKEI